MRVKNEPFFTAVTLRNSKTHSKLSAFLKTMNLMKEEKKSLSCRVYRFFCRFSFLHCKSWSICVFAFLFRVSQNFERSARNQKLKEKKTSTVKEVMKENCKSALRGVKRKKMSNKKKNHTQNDFMMKELRNRSNTVRRFIISETTTT